MKILSKPDHGIEIITDGKATSWLQLYLDDIEQRLNSHLLGQSIILPPYALASLPDAAKNKYGQIIVTDEVGGEVSAISDGINWRRSTDRAVVS